MKKTAVTAIIGICIFICAGAILWFFERKPGPIPVGIVCWMGSGAVVGSSEISAAALFLEEHPDSRIQAVLVDDQWNPEKTPEVIAEAMSRGVQFFISSHPSNCAVASVHLFADSSALLINAAATSSALSGREDYHLRIVADAGQEQQAIARFVRTLPGSRLLVLQDSGNLPYTDPAFVFFSEELGRQGAWQMVHRKLRVSAFDPKEFDTLMSEQFDALYILAGSFQAPIANIAQLFHHHHPDAPIVLTPWTRSPALLEMTGSAIERIILPSPYPSRFSDAAFDSYFRRFKNRFDYEPHSMTIGVWQALELLDQAFAAGHHTPESAKKYLLSGQIHHTSLGTIRFDPYGDVTQKFYFLHDLKKELQ